MTLPAIPKPNERNINTCWEKWKGDEKNIVQEKVLCFLFKKRYPENTKIEDILLKVSALNGLYNANISYHFDLYTVSKHILDRDIDERLRIGDIDLVDEIARVTSEGETKTLYSFASKYCHHHKPEAYPIIYDGYVEKTLMYFKRKDKFLDFKKDDLKKYKKFLRIIKAFKEHYDGSESVGNSTPTIVRLSPTIVGLY